ncbi:MAG TPA: oligosaccharide flippase family protein [Chitinophagaceae bacterium]|nr:oligosaccharide flippase family protein [Chitinophagaceae bacterium]
MLKQLFRNSFYLALPQLLTQAVSFFLMPLYMARLSPSDYGVMELLNICATVLMIIVTLQISQAIIRFTIDSKDEHEEKVIISTGFWSSFISIFTTFSILLLFSQTFNQWLTESKEYLTVYILFAFSFLINGVSGYMATLLIWQKKVKQSAISSGISIILTVGLSIWLILFMDKGIVGSYIAIVCSSAISLLVNYYFVKDKIKFSLSKGKYLEMIRFSTPLVFSALAWYSWYFIDRFMLRSFLSLHELGLFSVAAKFAIIFGVVLSVIESSFFPIVLSNYKDEKSPQKIAEFFSIVLTGILFLYCGINFFAKDIFNFLSSGEFNEAWRLLPLICLGQIFIKIYFFMPGFAIKRKTIYILYLSLAGTAVNILFNFLLISRYGLQGAAIATSLGAFFFLVAYAFISLKLYPIPFNWFKIILCAVIAGLLTALCYFLQLRYNADTFFLRMLLFCLTIGIALFVLIGRQRLLQYMGGLSLALQRKRAG